MHPDAEGTTQIQLRAEQQSRRYYESMQQLPGSQGNHLALGLVQQVLDVQQLLLQAGHCVLVPLPGRLLHVELARQGLQLLLPLPQLRLQASPLPYMLCFAAMFSALRHPSHGMAFINHLLF